VAAGGAELLQQRETSALYAEAARLQSLQAALDAAHSSAAAAAAALNATVAHKALVLVNGQKIAAAEAHAHTAALVCAQHDFEAVQPPPLRCAFTTQCSTVTFTLSRHYVQHISSSHNSNSSSSSSSSSSDNCGFAALDIALHDEQGLASVQAYITEQQQQQQLADTGASLLRALALWQELRQARTMQCTSAEYTAIVQRVCEALRASSMLLPKEVCDQVLAAAAAQKQLQQHHVSLLHSAKHKDKHQLVAVLPTVLYELQWQLLLVLHTHVGSDYWASEHGRRYTAATTAAATAAAAAASAEFAAQRSARIAAAAKVLHAARAHSRTAAATQLLTEAACTAVLDATCEHFISAAARAAGVCVTAERRITARVTSDVLEQLLEQCALEAVHAARCKAQTAQLQTITAAAAAAVAQAQAAEAATAAAALAAAEASLTELLAEAAVTSLTAAACEAAMTEAVRTVVTQHSGAQLVAELDACRCDALCEVVLQQSTSVLLEALLHAALRELSGEDEVVATAQLLVQRRIAAKAGAAVQKQLGAAAAIERAATKLQAMVRAHFGRRAMRAVIAARFVKLFDSDSGLWYWHDTMTSASFWEKPAIVSKFFKPKPCWAGPYKAIT
jgi:hypothetical protein